MKFTTLIFWGLLITALVMTCAGCKTQAEYCSDCPDCPVCGECYASEEHLNAHCATNFDCLQIEESLFGSHDFFLEGEDKMTSSTLATKCQACGIYFTYPDYEEHIKTCYP